MQFQGERIEFRKRRDFGEILNVSFTFIRQHFKPIFLNLLFIAGPFILVGSVLPGLLFFPWIGDTTGEGSFSQVAFTSIIVNVLSFIVGSVMAVSTVYEYMLLYMKTGSAKIQTSDVWKAVRKDFFTVLLTSSGVVIVYLFGVGFLGYLLFAMLGGVLGSILTLIATVYITVSFSLIIIVRLTEKVNFFEAVLRCYKLIEGRWWQTFALLFICYVVQTAMVSVIFIPFSIFSATEQLFSTSTPALTTSLMFITLAGIILVLAVTISFCLTLIVTGFQYFNLVEEKEAVGLLQRIGKIGTPPPSSDYLEEKEENY